VQGGVQVGFSGAPSRRFSREGCRRRVEQDRQFFLALAGVLLGFGVLMVHSASITSRPTEFEQVYLSRHMVFVCLGLAAATIAAALPAQYWRPLAPVLFLLTVALLVAVLVPGLGTRVNGSQRWLRYGNLSLQPSELAKLTLPLCLCWLIERRRQLLEGWIAGPLVLLLPIGTAVALVLLEPDLGTAMFLLGSAALVLFVSGFPLRNFIAGAACAIPLAATLVVLRPYQMKRITGFLAVWSDWKEAPYQLQQSLLTLGTGGISGVGLGKGWQKLSFLPEANTDFVFAVIGEELGLVGTLGLVLLWGGLYACGLRMLKPLRRDSFEYILGFTLLTQLVVQAALNIAVVTALVPPKGISHPLISYGGSNLVISLTALGMLLGLTRGERLEAGDADSLATEDRRLEQAFRVQ